MWTGTDTVQSSGRVVPDAYISIGEIGGAHPTLPNVWRSCLPTRTRWHAKHFGLRQCRAERCYEGMPDFVTPRLIRELSAAAGRGEPNLFASMRQSRHDHRPPPPQDGSGPRAKNRSHP